MAQGHHDGSWRLDFSPFRSSASVVLSTSFQGSLQWPWKLQTQISSLAIADPEVKHKCLLPSVPMKILSGSNLVTSQPLLQPPKQLLDGGSPAFWLTKPELILVLPPSNASWLLKWNQFSLVLQWLKAGDGASRARLGCCYLKKDLWILRK